MKFTKYFLISLLFLTKLGFAAERPDLDTIIYKAAKSKITSLQDKALKGDVACALAIYDFYRYIKNLDSIRDSSTKILAPLGLVDEKGQVSPEIYSVFRKNEWDFIRNQ